ncbi:hypothetical protein LQV05_001526 [Cryptococcus neoformans]|nr:hypothetical protein LQV05_001526 [Cryptococcus neoformans]
MNEEVFTAVPHADTGLSSPTEHQTSQPELACLTRSGSYVYPVCSRKSQLSATKVSVHDGTYQDAAILRDLSHLEAIRLIPHNLDSQYFTGSLETLHLFTGAALLLNLYGIQARGVTKPNIILGVALGLGGLGQIIAGILAWACGNTFGGNHYDSRIDNTTGQTGYHYSNTNGSYYYNNTNGSTYYNSGDGYAKYTSASGQSSNYYGDNAGGSKK